jgi:hypothetical protein
MVWLDPQHAEKPSDRLWIQPMLDLDLSKLGRSACVMGIELEDAPQRVSRIAEVADGTMLGGFGQKRGDFSFHGSRYRAGHDKNSAAGFGTLA